MKFMSEGDFEKLACARVIAMNCNLINVDEKPMRSFIKWCGARTYGTWNKDDGIVEQITKI